MKITMKHCASRLFMAITAIATLASCSSEEVADGDRLPDGKYPMTFSAAGLEAMANTRTVVTVTGKDKWEVNDLIGISINNGSSVEYKITDADNGAMEPYSTDKPCYWQSATEKILAWYPAKDANNILIDNQLEGKCSSFDYLVSEADYSYSESNGGSVSLPFKHAMAKVKYTIVRGEGVTDSEFNNAKVRILGCKEVSFKNGAVTGSDENVWITPAPNGTSGEALVVPQQMNGKQFIKVTIGSGADARDYFYTPASKNEANLQGGNQYTYNITVKKEGISVSEVSGVWNDEKTSGSAVEATSFHVTMPEGHNQTLTASDNATLDGNNYNVTAGSSFTLSYTVTSDNECKGFLAVKGLCDFERTYTTAEGGTTTYTFTYSNIRSDLWLSYTEYVQVGDYYYADGTWSSVKNESKTCIGIVFKTGTGAGDVVSNYSDGQFMDNTIHGYVVALNDVSGTFAWSTEDVTIGVSTNTEYFDGYSNTVFLKNKGSDDFSTLYPAAYQCSNYSTDHPDKSSGWYLPSAAQMKAVYDLKGTLSGKTDFIPFKTEYSEHYWISTESSNNYSYCFSYYYKMFLDAPKTQKKNIRAILTF